ncbi:Polyketide synthase modules and related proteins [hydrothermal vent metagenome]|uniref:Polyketide synthase modules and related proteins n=1 Tax=hydrothermal vent metagenome TaxID=652676 RepID=A0A3B0YXV3_9ZZZZ
MNELQDKLSRMSVTKLAYAAKKLESKQQVLQTEPIAIVGMACRLPGHINSVADYWQHLVNGVDGISEVPTSRWDNKEYYDPDATVPGKINTQFGGFIDDVDQFDSAFFGIAPIEAEYLDPQQRLLLELSWNALESANIIPEQLFNSKTGVFVGIAASDYGNLLLKNQEPEDITAYFGTGSALSIASGRLAYVLGLTGPCMSVDTACSSSLVSVHLACQSLRLRESDIALAAGVNLLLTPEPSINFSQANMLAADGHCKTFDDAADGYVRGEGCGVVVLKRLSDAISHKDNIVAVIRGSAVNQDGPSGGLTVPNGPSQKRMFNQVLASSGVDPAQIGYIEAHGTGTSLGDPIEIESLGDIFKQSHSKESPLYVGSAKTNIGHLEAAAGIAGLIKACLCLEQEAIAPHLHFNTPNTHVDWQRLPIKIPTELTPWKRSDQRRLAGVSSFGFSGTNAHIILEEAPAPETGTATIVERDYHLLCLTAKTEQALESQALNYRDYFLSLVESGNSSALGLINNNNNYHAGNISYTSHVGRSHFNHRLSVLGKDVSDWTVQLNDYLNAKKNKGQFNTQQSTNNSPHSDLAVISAEVENTTAKIGFLYTGQGSQYPDMCRHLYDSEAVFRDSLHASAELLKEQLPLPLIEVIYGKHQAVLNQTEYTQPALFAIEIALSTLWKSWGVEPDYVLGHSLGEYVAACVSGVMTIEEGLTLVATRGRLMQALPIQGGMLSVLGDDTTIKAVIAESVNHSHVEISAYNAPGNLVLSGQTAALEQVDKLLIKAGFKTRALNVGTGFHSALVEPMLNDFKQAVSKIELKKPVNGYISALSGMLADTDVTQTDYWTRHIREAVNFQAGVETLQQLGVTILIEIGPSPVLTTLAQQTLEQSLDNNQQQNQQQNQYSSQSSQASQSGADTHNNSAIRCLPSVRKNTNNHHTMFNTLAELYTTGVTINWQAIDQAYARRKVDLPTYAFQYERHWFQLPVQQSRHNNRRANNIHPILGAVVKVPAQLDKRFENTISIKLLPYLQDHQVFDEVIFPASGLLEIMVAALTQSDRSKSSVIHNVQIHKALRLSHTAKVDLHTVIVAEDDNEVIKIYSAELNGEETTDWVLHAQGTVKQSLPENQDPENHRLNNATPITLNTLRAEIVDPVSVADTYNNFRDKGIHYGPCFQPIHNLWSGDKGILGELVLPENLTRSLADYSMHPVLLDGCFQLLAALSLADNDNATYLPVGIDEIQQYKTLSSQLICHAQLQSPQEDTSTDIVADFSVMDLKGELLLSITGLKLKKVLKSSIVEKPLTDIKEYLFDCQWRKASLASSHLNPEYLLSPELIKAASAEIQTQLGSKQGVIDDEATRQIELLSTAYIINALIKAGWHYRAGEIVNLDDVIHQLGIDNSHRRLLRRLLEVLQEQGYLTAHPQKMGSDLQNKNGVGPRKNGVGPRELVSSELGFDSTTSNSSLTTALERESQPKPQTLNQWKVSKVFTNQPVSEHLSYLNSRAPWTAIMLKLLNRCGEGLQSVLSGQVDATELIFPGGNTEDASRLYQEAPAANAMNTVMQQSLLNLLKSAPQHRKVRILEIGAGTGGTTAGLLPYLKPDQVEYYFTDLTTLFTMQAEVKFKDFNFVHYGLLDIEKSPLEQGYQTNQFDVVIAANVIHATEDLDVAVKNINQVLATNGVLLLLEGIVKQTWLDLIFGLTDGWWRFTDTELRDYPLINPQQWQSLLANNEFEEIDCIQLASKSESDLSQQAVIIAQKSVSPANKEQDYWLVLSEPSSLRNELGHKLTTAGEVYQCIDLGTEPHYLDQLDLVLNQESTQCKGLLYFTDTSTSASTIKTTETNAQKLKETQSSEKIITAQDQSLQVLALIQQILNNQQPIPVWLISQQAQAVIAGDQVQGLMQSPLWGMGKVIALEHPELQCKRIDLDLDFYPALLSATGQDTDFGHHNSTEIDAELARTQATAQCLCDELLGKSVEDQIAYRAGNRYVARLAPYQRQQKIPPQGHWRVGLDERGSLDNIYFQSIQRRAPRADEVEIEIKAAGMNFRDVLNALGMTPGNPGLLGGECAGNVVAVGKDVTHLKTGDRVLGIAPGSFSQYVTVQANMIAKMASTLSYEQAASLPVVYLTTHYTLNYIGKLKAGQKILIHAASGGVGQAAIQLARKVGAEIYATASPGKWGVLDDLGVTHKMSSRSLDFVQEIESELGESGIDLVLNSLSGEYIEKSLSLIKDHGRFIEIGKRDVWSDEQMASQAPHVNYDLVDLVTVCEQDPALIQTMFGELMEWFESGELIAATPTQFPINQYDEAFRYMQQAKHTGKIVLQLPEQTEALTLKSNGSYLISGGLGGLGRLVAQWLIEQGAGHVILLSRRPADAQGQKFVDTFAGKVSVAVADVANLADLRSVIDTVEQQGELKGIIHAAGVLADGVIQQQNTANYAQVFGPKVQGTWNLHQSTLGKNLDFFVMFSSIAALMGSPGQSNHAAANSFMDTFATWRQAQSLPALSINWGVWSEVGAAALKEVDQQQHKGMDVISPDKGIEALDYIMKQCTQAQIAVFPVDLDLVDQAMFNAPFYAEMTAADNELQQGMLDMLTELPAAERQAALQDRVNQIAATVLGFKLDHKIDMTQGLFDLGMDSLTSIELRNRLQKECACSLSSTLLFEHSTLEELVIYLREEIIDLEFTLTEGMQANHSPQASSVEAVDRPMHELNPQETSLTETDLEDIDENQMAALLADKLSAIQEADTE